MASRAPRTLKHVHDPCSSACPCLDPAFARPLKSHKQIKKKKEDGELREKTQMIGDVAS